LESGLGSFGNQLAFALSYEGEDADGKSIHVRAVTTDEVHISVLETKEELRVPTESVKFGDDQGGFQTTTLIQSERQLRTVVVLPTLHLDELTDDGSILTGDIPTDGLLLGLKTKTGLTLTDGAHAPI
jgi:hypothetical protein